MPQLIPLSFPLFCQLSWIPSWNIYPLATTLNCYWNITLFWFSSYLSSIFSLFCGLYFTVWSINVGGLHQLSPLPSSIYTLSLGDIKSHGFRYYTHADNFKSCHRPWHLFGDPDLYDQLCNISSWMSHRHLNFFLSCLNPHSSSQICLSVFPLQ